jgi:hypothetical protein
VLDHGPDAANLFRRGQRKFGPPLQSLAADRQAIRVSGLDPSGGFVSFTGIVQSVEITQDAAKEKRFLVVGAP